MGNVPGGRQLYLTNPYMTGEDVLAVQRRLLQLGFDPYGLDGVFGPVTEAAVMAFQQSRGLIANGVIGPETFRALGLVAESDEVPSLPPPPPRQQYGHPHGDLQIVIDTVARRLTLFSGVTPWQTFPVAVGKPSTPSPVGSWAIRTKILYPGGVLGTRWLGLSVPWGNYGIHGTNNPSSIGHAVSNGCIRMFNHDIERLFARVSVGTPVIITAGGMRPPGTW